MSFADPQSVTIAGAAISLPRVSTGLNTSSYKSNDGLVALTTASSYGKRIRRTMRLDHAKIAADPLITGTNIRTKMAVYVVFDVPLEGQGYTIQNELDVFTGLATLMTASSGAKTTQLLGGEN